ncbi:hypothetical protein O4H52_00900 [Sphingomonadaceae bacterium G21617-S1]|nr:hypothetical protein [Sphingomonadaceae bacterium G21617-S1]
MSTEHLEGWMIGQHVWLADHFSVPAETLCLIRAPSPNADHFCLRAKGHAGAHEFHMQPDLRARSWKQIEASPTDRMIGGAPTNRGR